MSKRDFYEVLEVSKQATDDELKKAYRRLAMKFHPDRNAGDRVAEERFKEVNEAYEVLTDPQRRPVYDKYGHEGLQRGGGGGGADFGGFADVFGDVFADIFGASRGGPRRGADLKYRIDLTLEKAVFGTSESIRIPTLAACEPCHGHGTADGRPPQTCASCRGSGQTRVQQGFFVLQQTCPACRGRGRVVIDPCKVCRGAGRVRKEKTLEIKIPPGVDTGDRIRLTGEGEPGEQGAPHGDLYVQVQVKPHELFEREGQDLFCVVPVDFTTAALGGEVEVPTLTGHSTIKIPESAQSGKQFRLRGQGVRPVRGGAPGDLICQMVVETPVNLTKVQKDLLKQFKDSLEEGGRHHAPESHSWLEKAKRFVEEHLKSP